jgi:ketol-acid reductoisomerase
MFMPEARPVIYDDQISSDVLKTKKVAVIGYGAQGRAQARMLFESGIEVVVGLRPEGQSWQAAQEDGLAVAPINEAVKWADVVHILIPDESQKAVYEQEIEPNLVDGMTLSFSHGFNVVFDRIKPKAGVGVIMVAPKAPGTEVYKCFRQGFGVPGLFSVHQDNSENNAREIALGMSKEMGLARAGIMECTFAEEAYEDLFGEQAVLCGGLSALIKTGFEVLVEAGYPPEFAYFECLHEMKLIVDLVYEGGMERMWEVVSNTAEFGGQTRGSRVITPAVKEEMKQILKEVEDGTFAKEWMQEADENEMKDLLEMRRKEGEHPIEVVGKRIRGMFKQK